jgi:hypothetical protein
MMMRMVVAALVGLAMPAAAEPRPGCVDGGVNRLIMDWYGDSRDWVEFYSARNNGVRFDQWTLLHCPTGAGVGVTGFTPFLEPDDDPSTPTGQDWLAGKAVHAAIGGAVGGPPFPAGRKGADEVAARVRAAGVEATSGRGDRKSCVCDPRWKVIPEWTD